MEARDLPCVGHAALAQREHSVAHALWERRARGREHAHLLRWDIELDSRRVRAVPRSPRHDPDGDHLLNLSLSLESRTRSSRSRSLRSLNRGPCPCARRSAFQSHSDSLRERLAHGFVHGDAEFVHLVVVLSAEVHAVREDDHREVDRGIDPERGTRESGVPVRVEAHVAADHRLAWRAQREAETAANVVVANDLAARVTRAIAAASAAVPKRPACPATPPIAKAFSSWTSPRSRFFRHSSSRSVATHHSLRSGPYAQCCASTGPSTRSRTSFPYGAAPTSASACVSMM